MNQQDLSILRLQIWVSGRVQGVGFRMFVYSAANRLHLVGWVRNRYNGDVEIVAEGPQEQLLTLLSEVRMGPPASIVTEVKHIWEKPIGDFERFDLSITI